MPDSRHEILLDALLNGTTVDINPQSRAEEFLLALLNGVKDLPTPQSRLEAYYYALCQKGLGEGGGTGGGVQQVNEIIELVLANGNMVVTAPSGKAFKQVTVNKPATLVPENIAEGVNIAGVIGTYSGGGGGEGVDLLAQRVEGTITEYYNNSIEQTAPYAFYGCSNITRVDLLACTSIESNTFANCKTLSYGNFPECVYVGASAFYACVSLNTIIFPELSSVAMCAFSSCKALSNVELPKCISLQNSAFRACSGLTVIRLPVCTTIMANVFGSCRSLASVILGASSVCYLNTSTAFASTLIASGKGYIYVPASLVAEYQAATNWAYFSAQISAIEDMPT